MVRFHLLQEEKKDGYRTKKIDGGIHFVFRGKEHIGNILAPQLGGDKKTASQFKAIAKHWGKTTSHPSKHSAMEWLKNSHGLTVRLEDAEEVMNMLIESGSLASKLQKMDSSGKKEYFRDLYQQHIKNGMAPKYFKSPQHIASMIERQHKVPRGTYSGHVQENINEANGVSLFRYNKVTGYWKHERTFDEPNNAPTYLEHYKKNEPNEHFHIGKQLPKHNPMKKTNEGEEAQKVGLTPNSTQNGHIKKTMVGVVRKDPTKAVINKNYTQRDVTEAFLRVYHEATSNLNDPNDKAEANTSEMKPTKKKNTGNGNSEVIKLPNTDTHQPGPTIELNPSLNHPYDTPDVAPSNQRRSKS